MRATAIQTAFSFAPDKRAENIPDLEEVISGQQRLYKHTEGAFTPAKAKNSYICRDHHDGRRSLRLMEDSPMLEPSRLMVHLLRLLEDSLKIISG